jgi:selenocysteine lyase/cysteine desulfurase
LRDLVLPGYANTHTEDSFTGARTTRIAREAATYLLRSLHAGDDYAVAFPGTGSTGAIKRLQEILGVAVPSIHRKRLLDALPAVERWIVFVGPYEHHSNEVSWRESLAEVVVIPLDERGGIDLAALDRIVNDPRFIRRPKLGSFSAASNVTGVRTDVTAVARILRRGGAKVAFDFAAAAPYLDVDVHAGSDRQVDAAMLSPHKFLGGPGSPGMLVFHNDLYRLPAPTMAGGGTVAYVGPDEHTFLADIGAREDAGTPAIVQRIRAALAFRVKETIGAEAIEAREQAWIDRAFGRLRSMPGVDILGPVDAPRIAVASFLILDPGGAADGEPSRTLHPRFVIRLLSDLFGIQGRAGCSCAGPYGHALLGIDARAAHAYRDAIAAGFEGVKPGWSRLSFHWLADRAEVDFLLDAVQFVAEYGHRFVPLYAFDWRSGAWRWRGGVPGLPDASFEPERTSAASAWDGLTPADWAALESSKRSCAEDYASALEEARDWAARLSAEAYAHLYTTAGGGRDVPDEVDPELVFFRT